MYHIPIYLQNVFHAAKIKPFIDYSKNDGVIIGKYAGNDGINRMVAVIVFEKSII